MQAFSSNTNPPIFEGRRIVLYIPIISCRENLRKSLIKFDSYKGRHRVHCLRIQRTGAQWRYRFKRTGKAHDETLAEAAVVYVATDG